MRPKPETGESFIGYLVRLTELNGYDTPSWILSLADIDCMELQWTFSFVFGKTKRLERLARLTNNTLNDLNALVYSPANSSQGNTEHNYDFYGAPLNRSIIRPHQPKICPKCLAELGYCLRIWDCALVTTCPTHECMLLDKCPKCRRQIRAIRKRVSMCVCGCDWRDTDPQLVIESDISVSRRIYELCEKPPKAGAKLNNPLYSLNLRDFIIALTFVARLGRKMSRGTGRPSKSIKLSNKELHGLYAQAYAVFDDWPNKFSRLLNGQPKRFVRSQPHDGKLDTTLKNEFGSFYECLYNDLEGAQFDFMREAFVQFLNERMYSHSATATVSSHGRTSMESKYISVADARRGLKITHNALFDLVAAGEIHCAVINGSRSPEFALSATDVERIKWDYEQSITPRELARQLGVDCEMIRKLVAKGLIAPQARRSINAFNTLRFSYTVAEEVLARQK